MNLILFSIHDRVAGVYLAPFPARSVIDAVRSIKQSKLDPNIASTPIGQSPETFDLHQIGEFDDYTAEIIPHARSILLYSVADIWSDKTSSTVPS